MTQEYELRKTLVHLVRAGQSPAAAARQLGRSRAWGYKWWARFQVRQCWEDLKDHSRAPRRVSNKLPEAVHQAIRQTRSELEAETHERDGLGYIGAPAIQARLREQGIQPLPSISTIERTLHAAGMTRPHFVQAREVTYPHLNPEVPHQLIQADILPRYLTGGEAVACFNAIDVVSRYPSGRQYARRTAENACRFLLETWREQGLPHYQQVDNEACFSGGFKHPGVLGQVVRLALLVGTELVFSPFYHPESNGYVERFHQDYARFVWERVHLSDHEAVRQRSRRFFSLYRNSQHHSQLRGRSPAQVHREVPTSALPDDFELPKRLPLTAGRVHFIRAVDKQGQVKVLNLQWDVPRAQPGQGVWVTLDIQTSSATLQVFDAAPDAPQRHCLATHPFPLREKVQPAPQPEPPPPTWVRAVVWVAGVASRLLSTMS